jgi:hypothetical protein
VPTSGSTAAVAEASISPAPGPTQSQIRLFQCVLGVVIAWWFWLLWLVLTVSDPVVLSEPQVLKADAIVIGVLPANLTPQSPEARLAIEHVLTGRIPATELDVANLGTIAVRTPGTRVIVPLSRLGKDWLVTRVVGQSDTAASLVYPATNAALQSLQQLRQEVRLPGQ